MDEAISSIRQALNAKHENRVRVEEERQRELERQKVRAEELRQLREEEQRFEELKRAAKVWSQCERLRIFVAAWERNTEARQGQLKSGSRADAWRRWALMAIDSMDPLVGD